MSVANVGPIYNANGSLVQSTDPSVEFLAAVTANYMTISNFANVQSQTVNQVNSQVTTLSNAITLLREYTPQGYSSGTTPNTINLSQPPWNIEPQATTDLVTIMQALNANGLNQSGLFLNSDSSTLNIQSINWANATSGQPPYSNFFTQAGMTAALQGLQGVSTQCTTQLETLTTSMGQTIQDANTVMATGSSVVAEYGQDSLATAKAL